MSDIAWVLMHHGSLGSLHIAFVSSGTMSDWNPSTYPHPNLKQTFLTTTFDELMRDHYESVVKKAFDSFIIFAIERLGDFESIKRALAAYISDFKKDAKERDEVYQRLLNNEPINILLAERV